MSVLQILDFHEESFRLNADNFISVLRKVGARPVAIVSINGATRTGKSYALNYFIQYLESGCPGDDSWYSGTEPIPNKFVYRSGKERTTVGIMLWSEPYFVQQNGREIAVLLMDTQGLFDKHTSSRQNAIIYSLSALCSSMSIFNMMKDINENVLQQIDFFSSYAHLVSTSDEGENSLEAGDSFQKLVFLIRDFDFPEYEFGHHSMKPTEEEDAERSNYCRDVFIPSGENIPLENLFVREKIRASYQDISAFVLPYPGITLKKTDVPNDEEFRILLMSFVQRTLSPGEILTKKFGGREVTGSEFEKYIFDWARLCERADDHFPAVQTIRDSTAIIQNSLALHTAVSLFEKEIDQFFIINPNGLPDKEYRSVIGEMQEKALTVFHSSQKLEHPQYEAEYREKLLTSVESCSATNRNLNQLLQTKLTTVKEVEKHKVHIQQLQENMEKAENQNEAAQAEIRAKIKESEEMMKKAEGESRRVELELEAKIKQSWQSVAEISKRGEEYREDLRREQEHTRRLLALQEQRMTEAKTHYTNLQVELIIMQQLKEEIRRKNEEQQAELRRKEEECAQRMAAHQQAIDQMQREFSKKMRRFRFGFRS